VPELLEGPHREERRHLGIVVRGRDQQVAQVADGVVLDVVHVAEQRNDARSSGRSAEGVEVDVLHAHSPAWRL
jgi:hypothetical protein